jgi:menaquinone-specific isochorismate synthase
LLNGTALTATSSGRGYAGLVTRPDLTPPRLCATTTEVTDDAPLIDYLPSTDGYAWIRRGEGMVGWGEVVRHKPESLAAADVWWQELAETVEHRFIGRSGSRGPGVVAFGSFVFDPDNTADQSTLVVPQVIVRRHQGKTWITRVGSDAAVVDQTVPSPLEAPRQVEFDFGALTPDDWAEVVAEAVRRIGTGGLDKVVLARDVTAMAANELDARFLVAQLTHRYPRCWTYLVDGLVGSTPEMLVRRESGLATSRVLAGTIRRTGDGARDLALAVALAQSSKDLEEHEYAVRSVAAALAPLCSGMNVPDAPYVLDLPNVLHLATDVTAVADPSANALTLAAALHPTAAVCGTPTHLARATIAELEHLDRGRYAGPVGWIGTDGDGEWAIALRCGQIDDTDRRRIRLFAGCGIVAGSDPGAELAESVAKLLPMRYALTE